MKLSFALGVALLLATAIPAQLPVSLSGRVEAAPAGACNADATHRVVCTEVLLVSSTVDLTQWEGQIVDLSGSVELNPGCTTVDVQVIAAASARTIDFSLGGYRLGSSVLITSFTPPGAIVVYWYSCGSGFLPLGELGTILLDLSEYIYVGTNLSIGIDIRSETIPNDPTLVGAIVYYQYAYASIGTGAIDFGFLNPGCIQIRE